MSGRIMLVNALDPEEIRVAVPVQVIHQTVHVEATDHMQVHQTVRAANQDPSLLPLQQPPASRSSTADRRAIFR